MRESFSAKAINYRKKEKELDTRLADKEYDKKDVVKEVIKSDDDDKLLANTHCWHRGYPDRATLQLYYVDNGLDGRTLSLFFNQIKKFCL